MQSFKPACTTLIDSLTLLTEMFHKFGLFLWISEHCAPLERCFRKHHHQASSRFTWEITQIEGFKGQGDEEIQSSSQLVQCMLA